MGCQASRHSAEAEEEQQGVVRACIATDEGGDDEAAGRRYVEGDMLVTCCFSSRRCRYFIKKFTNFST